MIRTTRRAAAGAGRLAALAVAGLALLGCEREATPGATPAEGAAAAPATAAAAPVDSASAALAEREARSSEAQPRRIYYDLTRFDWYRRGESLVAEGVAYEQTGDPVTMAGDSLRLAGTYQDVDYYVRVDDDARGVVFVPVFQRYWLPFARAGAGTGSPPDSATG